ncbi:MAG: hypothetical protein A3C35_02445 [Omnitrophica bacterium RIFCSPHIGHO2_02_FULL_46_11]|nr:MAG: hypothetical protein A3C35_02445 [Omnitrophica bacterium RIFCSPHIGHO2_02_FULL_46_11]OGW85573.1 MAG: hypothetical protein A3A81_01160 [Omnitrophica bacterium RIFCSPLOWO2_01_FULL_45_10b]
MLKEFILNDTASLQDCVSNIMDPVRDIVFIVDSSNRLLGCVAESDIRRLILSNVPLNSRAVDHMNKNVKFFYADELESTDEWVKKLSNFKYYGYYPVLNKDRTLKRVIHYSDLITDSTKVIFDPSSSQADKILIAGGAGYIGSVLTEYLLNRNYQVVVMDRFLYGRQSIQSFISHPKFSFYEYDIRNISNVIPVIKDVRDVVYLAEIVGDPAVNVSPRTTLETNYLSVLTFANLAKYAGIKKFIYASSCSVYGKSDKETVNELSNLNPISLYAKMKILCENALLDLSRHREIFQPIILRLSTVFGLSLRPRFDLIINKMTADAAQKGEISIYGGTQYRPFVHVHDVARAIELLLRQSGDLSGQIYNIGSDALNFSIEEIAQLVLKHFPSIKVNHDKTNRDERSYVVDFSKIKQTLGYEPSLSIDDGIFELKKFLARNHIQIEDPRYSNLKTMQNQMALQASK